MGYVDIHSHILYAIDDGPEEREQSIRVLEIAAASGTSDIVATPHVNSRYAFDEERIDAQIRELSARSLGERILDVVDLKVEVTPSMIEWCRKPSA